MSSGDRLGQYIRMDREVQVAAPGDGVHEIRQHDPRRELSYGGRSNPSEVGSFAARSSRNDRTLPWLNLLEARSTIVDISTVLLAAG
jgi:hypothetical protein